MIPVDQAVAVVVAAFQPLPPEVVGLDAASGRVLAEDLTAGLTQPPTDVSAMDGYAVRSEDVREVPATLRLIGQSAAGACFSGSVGPDEAVRIFTGASVPAGADAIVIQENAQQRQGQVLISEAAGSGSYIRRKGQDFSSGDVLLRAGRRLSPRDIGLAAAMNLAWLPVRRKPRVALLATGNELVMPGEAIGRDRIVSSAGFAVAAFVRRFGAEPMALGIARDNENSFCEMLQRARGADLLITIGGASVGDFDLVRRALGTSGFDLKFQKVAMRPGKPLIFGRLGHLPVLGLPGNPVSAAVTSVVFAKPAIERMLGITHAVCSNPTARLAHDLPANGERQEYLRAILSRTPEGELVARPFDSQDSSLQRLLAAADCLVVRPPDAPSARAGERVAIVEFGDDPLLATGNAQEALDERPEPN
jgi:molybdopterin molybdotransferase